MSTYRFSEEELKNTLKKYPKLEQGSDGVLTGEIDINHQYDDTHLVDSFKISIEVDSEYPKSFPKLYEVGDRTKKIADKYRIRDYRDLHCYAVRQAGSACLCAPQEKRIKFPEGSDLSVYIDSLVVPYLFGLSYYDKFEKWPWGERSHGAMGALEAYADLDNPSQEDIFQTLFTVRIERNWIEYHKQIRKISPLKNCPCDSRKSFSKCHGDAFLGIKKLSKDVRTLKVNIKSFLDMAGTSIKKNHHTS